MKKRLKMKKYESGGGVDDDDPESQRVFRSDLTEYSDEERMPRGSKSVARKAAQTGAARASAMEARGSDDREISSPPSRSPSMTESPKNAITGAGAAFDRRKLTGAGSYSKLDEDARSGAKGRPMTERESKAANAAGLAATMIPAGRVAKGAYEVGKAATTARRMGQTVKAYDAEKAAAAGERAAKLAEFEAKRAARRGGGTEGRMGVTEEIGMGYKRGGSIKRYSSGGSVSASRRADGIANRGKTRGKIV
jgi:hypothetical protein